MTKTKCPPCETALTGAAQKESTEAMDLKMLDDSTRISLAIAMNKASNALAERDGDELLNTSETVLALAEAADIHGWTRERPLKVTVNRSTGQ
jgi:hypothetical protein